MKRNILCISLSLSLILSAFGIKAQEISFYHDYLDNLWIFDSGNTKQIEHLPVKSYGVGNKSFVYEDNAGCFKIYNNHYVHKINSFVTKYTVTDNLIAFNLNTQLKVYDNENIRTLTPYATVYYTGDDVILWFDNYSKMLMAYWNGDTYPLDDALTTGEAGKVYIGKNIAAFTDVNNWVNIFFNGNIEQLIYAENLGSISVGKDIVAFVDKSMNNFQVYYNGEFIELESFVPHSFKCADQMVAYVDASNYLKIFHNYQSGTLSFDAPDFYDIVDGILVYGLQNYFKAYIDGKVYDIENFIPEKYFIKNKGVVYLDQMGNLKYFKDGKSEIITYEKATSFELTGDAVRYSFGIKSENIYLNGKTYKNE